jgi:hypothetical protein
MIRCTYRSLRRFGGVEISDFLTDTVFSANRLVERWNNLGDWSYDILKTRPYNDDLPEDGWLKEGGISYCKVRGVQASVKNQVAARWSDTEYRLNMELEGMILSGVGTSLILDWASKITDDAVIQKLAESASTIGVMRGKPLAGNKIKRILLSMLNKKTSSVKELISMARELTAADVDLEVVAGVVRNNNFLSLRHPLERMNVGKVTLDDSGDYMRWMIKTRRGKTIAIVSTKGATPGLGDIVVRDLVIGYL